MDFWDLTVVIFRRWKVAVPLLLAAIGATAFVAITAKPDYTMTSYVQFIPAKVDSTDDSMNASLRNPWNQLGLATLGQAAIYTTQDQTFLDSLKASKHTTTFTLTMTQPNPIVTVEVVGSTSQDARVTTELVVSRLRASAEALQKQSGVQEEDLIPTRRLDQGQNVVPSSSKVKRAVAAVAAAGLLMMAAGTVGFDALARRRSRRRTEREQAESPPQETLVTEPANCKEVPSLPKVPLPRTELGAPAGEPTSRPQTAVTPEKPVVTPEKPVVPPEKPAERPVSLAGTASRERTAIVVKRSASVAKPPPAAATYRSANARNEVNGVNHDAVPPATNGDVPAPSDVRVVLPPKRADGENGGKSK